jgi:hypothetical protein
MKRHSLLQKSMESKRTVSRDFFTSVLFHQAGPPWAPSYTLKRIRILLEFAEIFVIDSVYETLSQKLMPVSKLLPERPWIIYFTLAWIQFYCSLKENECNVGKIGSVASYCSARSSHRWGKAPFNLTLSTSGWQR